MLTELESAVLDRLLGKPGESFEILRQQLQHATVSSREFTRVGFLTYFSVAHDAPIRQDVPNMAPGYRRNHPMLKHGAGFALFVREGVISMLEGFTYDEKWPDSTDGFELYDIALT